MSIMSLPLTIKALWQRITNTSKSIKAIAKAFGIESGLNDDGTLSGKQPGSILPPSDGSNGSNGSNGRDGKSLIERIRELEQNVLDITSTDSADNPVKKYIDNMDKLNLSPKVGYLDEKTVPLFASYSMNYIARNSKNFYPISDSYGREVVYIRASTGAPGAADRVFKGTRISTIDKFVIENIPIKASYMGPNDYITNTLAVGADYIIYTCVFNGKSCSHLVKTYGSSNPNLWKEYVDITSITDQGVGGGMQYFSDFKTIATYHTSGSGQQFKLTVKVFKESDKSLIKSVDVINFFNDFKAPADMPFASSAGQGYDNLWMYDAGSACYVRKTQKFVFMGRMGLNSYNSNRTPQHTAKVFSWVYSVPQSFFQSGEGGFTRVLKDDYHIGLYNMLGENDISSKLWGTTMMTYDEYEDVFRVVSLNRDDHVAQIFTHAVKDANEPVDKWYGVEGAPSSVTTPDAMPWGKKVRGLFTLFGKLMAYSGNATGWTTSIIEPQKSSVANVVECIPGRSATLDWNGFNINAICSQRIGNTMYYYYPSGNKILRLNLNGTRVEGAEAGYPEMPTSRPNGVNLVRMISYNQNTRVFTYLAADTVAGKENYPCFCTYSVATGAWAVYRDYSKFSPELTSYFAQNWAVRKACQTDPQGVTFTDTDGTVSIMLYFHYGNWARERILTFNPSNGTVTGGKINFSDGWGYRVLDWSSNYGYTAGYQDWSEALKGMRLGKDFYNGAGAEKSREEVFNGSSYSISFGVSSASGLVAYLSEMPIFLGGYFSVCDAREITLMPNSDNYVYLSRDRVDRQKINIYVKKKQFGQDGETAFNRILVARIRTNSANAIETQYYSVG